MQPILYLSGLFLLATPTFGDGEKIVGGEEAAPHSIPWQVIEKAICLVTPHNEQSTGKFEEKF